MSAALAAPLPAKSSVARLFRNGDLLLTGGLFATVLVMILPVSPFLLDGFLAISIMLSLLTLLVILYVKEPADFTSFPTLLLFLTLLRLSLNIASTRLILLDGYAGHIIEAFGNFVVRGNYVVGLVVFCILVIINFVVITKGAGRIAEVAARFTLDAMPGKQMAIDAELNAGVINEADARSRRRQVEQEADFYGAMDGASKFVRGDAIAAVLITLINVIGGFAIGVLQKGMTVTDSLQRFTLLSIGDGLVAQIPALVTSTAAGILVTRAAAKETLGVEMSRQLLLFPRALKVLTVMLLILALVPGLPMMPFLMLAVLSGFLAYSLNDPHLAAVLSSEAHRTGAGVSGEGASPAKSAIAGAAEKLETLLNLDPLQIELGYGLVSLADAKKGGDLLERVTGVRKNLAQEVGVIIPPIRLRDNLQLEASQYRFLLKGQIVAQGQLMPGHWLAMNATSSKVTLKGTPTVEPVFKLPATWITDVERKNAEISGYTVVDAASVLVTHLTETLKRNAHEILTRQDVQTLLDNLKQTHSTVISELIPAQLTVGQIQRVLQNLLAEGVSIRNLASILEKVSDHAPVTKNPDELSEQARRALGSQIVKPFQDDAGRLRAIALDPRLEQQIAQGIRQTPTDISLMMDPKLARHVVDALSHCVQKMLADGLPPLVLCSPHLRLPFRRFFETTFADLAVLSYAEIPPRVEVQNVDVIPGLGNDQLVAKNE
jgi:flagellar biosynthesis protein FlhA